MKDTSIYHFCAKRLKYKPWCLLDDISNIPVFGEHGGDDISLAFGLVEGGSVRRQLEYRLLVIPVHQIDVHHRLSH